MKSFRWTFVFGCLVAGLAAFAIFDFKKAEKQQEQKEKDAAVVRIQTKDVVRFELVTRAGSTVVEKAGSNAPPKNDAKSDSQAGEPKDDGGGQWRLTAPLEDVADTPAVMTFLSTLESEKVKDTVIEGDGISWATYGLDVPVTRLKVKGADGREQEVKIGAVKAYDGSLYARIGDENKVLLVESSWDAHLSKPAREFRDKKLFRSSSVPAYDSIEIVSSPQGPKSAQASTLSLKKVDGVWKIPADAHPFPLSNDAITVYIEQIRNLRVLDFLDESPKDSAKGAKAGLAKPELVVRLREGDHPPFEVKFAAVKNGGKSEGKGEDANPVAVSTDLAVLATVFKSSVESLKMRAEDFYDKKLPFQFSVADVGRVSVKSAKLTADFLKEGGAWVPADKGSGKEVDGAKIDGLLSKLNHLEAIRFLQPIKKGESPKLASESVIKLAKAGGEPVFELAWGDAIADKGAGAGKKSKSNKFKHPQLNHPGQPDGAMDGEELAVRYHSARTSQTDRQIGVSEGDLSDLELDKLLKEKKPQPTPTATPGPAVTSTHSDAR